MKHQKFTLVALFATTLLAGTLMASAISKAKSRGLDPMIIEIMDRVETGTMGNFKVDLPQALPKRQLNRKYKPAIGVQRDNTRLQIKFVDELKVRIAEDGSLYSKTNRNIDVLRDIAENYGLTFTRSIDRSEADIEALMARAELRAKRQTPDIAGLYWVDGNGHGLSSAATELHRLDEVEYVFWNTIFDPRKHTSEVPSIFSEISQQMAEEMLENQMQATTPVGACYLIASVCEPKLNEKQCIALNGTFLGSGSICPEDDGDEFENRGSMIGACCVIFGGAALAGVDGVAGCFDNDPDEGDGISQADCYAISAWSGGPVGDAFMWDGTPGGATNVNGVWFEETDCAGIMDECNVGAILDEICGEDDSQISMFAGDCYHDQTQFGWVNRPQFLGAPICTPGCWDSPGYPNAVPTNDDIQGCCTFIIELEGGEEVSPSADCWDDIAASIAHSAALTGSATCRNGYGAADIPGPSGDCASPFGNNFRSFPTQPQGTRGVQPMVLVSTGAVVNRTVGFPPAPYGCGWDLVGGRVPGQPTTVLTATTPDYFYSTDLGGGSGLGVLSHMTDEQLQNNDATAVGFVIDPALLPWPMGGAEVGDAVASSIYPLSGTPGVVGSLPVIASPLGRGDSRWDGTGLNLFADGTNPVGIGNGNPYTGLYGLGFRRQEETGAANGTHGLGVQVAVLDYSAFLQQYTDTAGNQVGAVHEDLGSVLLEGPQTGHDALQMIFNPPDAADFPFDYPQSPNHGTAQVGVIAASWQQTPNPNGTMPLETFNIGALGIAPNATTAFFPLIDLESLDDGTGGRQPTAWFNAMEWLRFGDVLSAGYIGLDFGTDFSNISFNPANHTLIETATNLGISVVIGAGDYNVDLEELEFPNEIDPGHISVCAITPGGGVGGVAKRWANSRGDSNYVAAAIDVSKNTCAAWGAAVVTTGMGPGQDNWLGYKTNAYTSVINPQEVQARSYTNNFGGTAAAASISAALVANMQGYSRQVFQTPLSPSVMRQFAAHGQMLGVDPDTGEAIFANIAATGTDNNVVYSTENSMTTSDYAGESGFDMTDAGGAGLGNIVGYFLDARYACIRMTVDPLFESTNVFDIMFIRGDMIEGTAGSPNATATLDGVFMAAVSEHTPIGDYDVPASVPGGSVQYNFTGETTDLYFTGEALDPRGDPLLTLNNITLEVDLAPTQAEATMLQFWMWDFDRNEWVQPSVTGVLPLGSTESDFDIVRASSLLDTDGTYHARLVSISGAGPFNRFPVYYDQIRMVPTIPTTQP